MLDEKDLVFRVLSGDLQAFDRMVKQYQVLVFHIIRKLIDNQQDVEDVGQEVFVKVYNGLHQFGFRSKLSTWIGRIAYLTAINHLKKTKGKPTMVELSGEEEWQVTEQNPVEELTKKDFAAYIHQMVGQLPMPYKVLVSLYHLHGFSYLEMVEITGIPEGTIKSYLFRARKMLKDQLIANVKTKEHE